MDNKIVNIVNFVRVPKDVTNEDKFTLPVKKEIELNKKYGFKNTFLLQYDAIISKEFQEIFLAEKDENMELGIWFECVRQLVEKVGLKWRGKPDCNWDWHVVPGFLMAYTNEEKKLLIDEAFARFYEIYQFYPTAVGSWMLDSWSIAYMKERYHIKAAVICREQYGVDAYTLWGGYYNQGYYPSKNNVLCPGQTEDNTIKVPVFRMLGPDPIYCYDEKEFETGITVGCATMEPVWEYGATERIFSEYLDSYYNEECMDFAYTTMGQESPFGWSRIGPGLTMQFEKLNAFVQEGKVRVETLSQTGEWFSNRFDENPVVSLISHGDWAGNNIKSIWYNCKNYRANLLVKDDAVYFRDINKFDERYCDRYKDEPCTTWNAMYDNLPVVDGRIWNDNGIKAGLKLDAKIRNYEVHREENGLIFAADTDKGPLKIHLLCDCIVFEKNMDAKLYFERGCIKDTEIRVEGSRLECFHNQYQYTVRFSEELIETANGYEVAGSDKVFVYLAE